MKGLHLRWRVVVSCFNFNAYANIITGVVIGLIVLVVWLKYKKQICDCES